MQIDIDHPEDIVMDISTEAASVFKDKIKSALKPIFDEALSEIVSEIDPAAVIVARVGTAVPSQARPARAPRRSGKRVRRSPTQLAADAVAVEKYVLEHPGLGVNEIAKGVNIPPTKLRSIMQTLRSEKRISDQGTKVHMTYWPPVGAAPKVAAKPVRKPSAAKAAPAAKKAAGPGPKKARRRTVPPPAAVAAA